jgi:hypothetical protein
MDEAVKFRLKAEDCRRQAQGMPLGEHRDTLLEIALQWDLLADSAEKRMEKKDVEPDGSAVDDSSS